jgi:hypothetical protein
MHLSGRGSRKTWISPSFHVRKISVLRSKTRRKGPQINGSILARILSMSIPGSFVQASALKDTLKDKR